MSDVVVLHECQNSGVERPKRTMCVTLVSFFSNLSIPVNFLSFKSRMHEWFLWLLHKCGSTSEVMSQRLKIVHTYYYGQWNIQPRLIHIYRFCQILRCKFIGLFAARSIVLKIERKSVGGIDNQIYFSKFMKRNKCAGLLVLCNSFSNIFSVIINIIILKTTYVMTSFVLFLSSPIIIHIYLQYWISS